MSKPSPGAAPSVHEDLHARGVRRAVGRRARRDGLRRLLARAATRRGAAGPASRRQAQRIGIGLQRLGSARAAAVGLGQGRPTAKPSSSRRAATRGRCRWRPSTQCGAARRGNAQRACQRRRRCTAVRPCRTPPSLHGSTTSRCRRRRGQQQGPPAHRPGSSTSTSRAEASACVSSSVARTGCQVRAGRRALQAQAVVRQATELAVVVEHPGRRRRAGARARAATRRGRRGRPGGSA